MIELIDSKRIKVEITLNEEILGSGNKNPDVHKEYVASRVTVCERPVELERIQGLLTRAG